MAEQISKVLDPVDTRGWRLPYRVTFRLFNGKVFIDKVEAFLEFFQIYKDITTDMLPKSEEFLNLREKIYDWYIDEQYDDLNRRRARKYQYNNDDPNPAA